MFVLILLAHTIADFPAQSHWMASNKSKDMDALLLHVFVYSLIMSFGFLVCLNLYPVAIPNSPPKFVTTIAFFMITFITHMVTDAITSRISGHLFKTALDNQKDYEQFGRALHDFFVVIGFDQFIHLATLYFTLKFFGYGLL